MFLRWIDTRKDIALYNSMTLNSHLFPCNVTDLHYDVNTKLPKQNTGTDVSFSYTGGITLTVSGYDVSNVTQTLFYDIVKRTMSPFILT